MEKRTNIIQRIKKEELTMRRSFSNLSRELSIDKLHNLNPNNGNKNSSIYKQASTFRVGEQEPTTTLKNFQQQQSDKDSRKSKEFLRLQFKPTKTIKEVKEDEAPQIWQRLDEIIKRIKFKKYIRAFLQLSRLRLQRYLTPAQILNLNDASYWNSSLSIEEEYQGSKVRFQNQGETQKTFFQALKNMEMPIFSPHHFLYQYWQFLKIVSAMICFYCYLVSFALDQDLDNLFPIQLLLICQTCIIIDIFVSLNTGIYIKGVLCTDRKELFSYYKSSKTIYYDIASTFFTTLYYILYFNGVKKSQSALILLLPIVFKYNDFFLIIKKLKQRFLLDRRAQNIIELINLLKNILVISHIFACIWLWVGLKSESIYSNGTNDLSNSSAPKSWLDLVNVQQEPWSIQYLNAFYYIVVTMSTVGYGDIRATNPIEVFVAVFLVMTCSVIFGFTLNSIGEIFQDFFQFEKQIQEKRYIIANYMDKNCIDQKTRQNIFEYLEYYWKDQINENTQEESSIISHLSDNLKEELLIQSNRLILKQNRVLRDNFSTELLAKCIPIIQEQKYTQNEVIIDQASGNTDCSIYFVLLGEVEVLHGNNISSKKSDKKKQHSIQKLKRGESFGEKSFFTGDKNCLNIRSKGYSKLLKIKREDFINILQGDQEQYEIFCSLNDKITFSPNTSFLSLQCGSCKDTSHGISSCPFLHYIPRKLKLLGKNLISEVHTERDSSFVRKSHKMGTLEQNDLVSQHCYDYFQSNFEEILEFEEQYHTFTQFSSSKTPYASDDENDTKSAKDILKSRKKLGSSEAFESPTKRKLNSTRRLGFLLSQNISNNVNTREHFGLALQNSLDEINNQQEANLINILTGTTTTTNNRQTSDCGQMKNTDQDSEQSESENSCNPENSKKIIQNLNGSANNLSSGNNYRNIEKQVSFARKQFFQKKQRTKEIPNSAIENKLSKSISMTKIADANQTLFSEFRQEYADYDQFDGRFETMAVFNHYFPNYNYKNVITRLQAPQIAAPKIQMKESNPTPLNKRLNNRNLQSFIHREVVGSQRSITRIKVKVESPSTSGIYPNQLQNNNITTQMKDSNQESIVINSQFEQQSNLDNLINQNYSRNEEPNTPPRNEYGIAKDTILSLANIKNCTYNFGILDISSASTIRQEDME